MAPMAAATRRGVAPLRHPDLPVLASAYIAAGHVCIQRYLEDGRDWRKVSPLEIQRQLRACDLPLWRHPKGPKMTGLEVARAAPMAQRLEGLLAAVVAGILQAVDQGCFWGPGFEVPRCVKIQGVPSPMSRLVLLPSSQKETPLEVGAGGLKASDLLAVDVAAEAALREAKPKVGLVRFSARRLPGLRRLDLTDPLLVRSSYCKALMEMERQIHAPLPTLEADAVVATSDVSILRGPVEAGAPWTETQPARIEVFWAQLERNPHFDDLGYLDEASEDALVMTLRRLMALAKKEGVSVLVIPPPGAGTPGGAWAPSAAAAERLREAALAYGGGLEEIIVCREHPSQLCGRWGEFTSALQHGNERIYVDKKLEERKAALEKLGLSYPRPGLEATLRRYADCPPSRLHRLGRFPPRPPTQALPVAGDSPTAKKKQVRLSVTR